MGDWLDALKEALATLPFAWIIASLGGLGVVGAILAIALNRRRLGAALGMAALVLAVACATLGALSVVVERGRADRAAQAGPTEVAKQRARRAGYERARGGAELGLVASAPALFGGLFGVLAPMLRRRKPRPMSMRMPRSIRSQAKHEWTTPTGLVTLSASGFAVLAVAACAAVWTIPLPGPALAAKDPAWDAREAIEIMGSGAFDEGCTRLATACLTGCEERKVPDLVAAATECAENRLDAALEHPTPEAIERVERFANGPTPIGEAERQRIRDELDRLATPSK
ncbi:MAG: hypothetical protein U0414_18275 [Polyangiaceae bacterium]